MNWNDVDEFKELSKPESESFSVISTFFFFTVSRCVLGMFNKKGTMLISGLNPNRYRYCTDIWCTKQTQIQVQKVQFHTQNVPIMYDLRH